MPANHSPNLCLLRLAIFKSDPNSTGKAFYNPKPEKLIAKLILASSRPGDFVFDPFLGSGTTAVVAKKLGHHFSGIEIEPDYYAIAIKRLQHATTDRAIQGYHNGCFWERNRLLYEQKKRRD